MSEGGIGIGVPIGYLPKTNPKEMYKVFQLAGELNVLVFTHIRIPDVISIQEVIANAAVDNVFAGQPIYGKYTILQSIIQETQQL